MIDATVVARVFIGAIHPAWQVPSHFTPVCVGWMLRGLDPTWPSTTCPVSSVVVDVPFVSFLPWDGCVPSIRPSFVRFSPPRAQGLSPSWTTTLVPPVLVRASTSTTSTPCMRDAPLLRGLSTTRAFPSGSLDEMHRAIPRRCDTTT